LYKVRLEDCPIGHQAILVYVNFLLISVYASDYIVFVVTGGDGLANGRPVCKNRNDHLAWITYVSWTAAVSLATNDCKNSWGYPIILPIFN